MPFVQSSWDLNTPPLLLAGPGAIVGDGGVSNGGLIHRVGSLTKVPNGSEHDEHVRRGDNMRSSVNQHYSRRPSVKNGMLDHAHKRPSYYKHGRYEPVKISRPEIKKTTTFQTSK